MATMKMPCAVGTGSGEEKTYYYKTISVSAGYIPTWNNTPIEANKIYMSYLMSNGAEGLITNVNPTTGEVDNTTLYFSNDYGQTWDDASTYAAYDFVVTSTSITMNQRLSSSYSFYIGFAITD